MLSDATILSKIQTALRSDPTWKRMSEAYNQATHALQPQLTDEPPTKDRDPAYRFMTIPSVSPAASFYDD